METGRETKAKMPVDPASYRDPAGHVYQIEDKIYRTVLPAGRKEYEFVRDSGALAPLVERGLVVSGTEVKNTVLGREATKDGIVLEHPRIPFVSYPYEWTFAALKAAALLHLEIQIELLKSDIVLSDATAFNVQFVGTKPIFIDTLSFRRYRQNEHWLAHRQFCEQFLNPLLLYARLGIPFNGWLRGSMEGIPAEQLASALNLRDKLSVRTMSHVTLPARLQKGSGERQTEAAVGAKSRGLPKSRYNALLEQLKSWISSLEPKGVDNTVWRNYAKQNTYEQAESEAKHGFIASFVERHKPHQTLDLGCNTGEFSRTALKAGAEYAIGVDADHGALEAGFEEHNREDGQFLMLYQDATNPSPAMGWNCRERKSFTDRCKTNDALFALAFEHHLAIARNVPFDNIIDWMVSLAPSGIIEFVPKDDPTVQQLLALRDDIFDSYTEQNFKAAISKRARILRSDQVSNSKRVLIEYIVE